MPKLIKKQNWLMKGVAVLAGFLCWVGVGTSRKTACQQSGRTSCVESTQGGLPVWTSLMPPSHQEGPLASYTKDRMSNNRHITSTHIVICFPLHCITPQIQQHAKQSLLHKCTSRSLLQKSQKLTMCELKYISNYVHCCRFLFSKDNQKIKACHYKFYCLISFLFS